jgi:hypothetical protein
MLVAKECSRAYGAGGATSVTYDDETQLEAIFAQVGQRYGAVVARQVHLIVGRNLRSGRAGMVLAQTRNLTLADYVWRVVAQYREPGPYFSDSRHGRELNCQTLFASLQAWAYNWYVRHGQTEEQAAQQASTSGRRALLLIAHRPYTYDVPFDAWAVTLLRQLCAESPAND